MSEKVDVVIIGAGSAGLSALRQVQKQTENYIIIDKSPLGTKCARTGCMPSKALISLANDYHRCKLLSKHGINGTDKLNVNISEVLRHVRSLRDYFTNGMIKTTKNITGDKLIIGHACIINPNCVRVNNEKINTEKIIIATGSKPKIPVEWQKYKNQILTSENIFEQENLPDRIAIIGLGPIGLELGQALKRLELDITAFDKSDKIASITNPDINYKATYFFNDEFNIHSGSTVELREKDNQLFVQNSDIELAVDAVLAAVGVEPDIEGLGLENLGLKLDKKGLLPFEGHTSQIGDLPVFIAGDVNGCRPILHEALDEGFIAGKNCSSRDISTYCRRTLLQITFSDPQIAVTGSSYETLLEAKKEFVIGQVDFSEQSRALLEHRNKGLLQIYADKNSAEILGAECICPDAEHLAHQLAFAIENELTIFDMLKSPFYHPCIEESLRSALRDAAKKIETDKKQDLSLCESSPEEPLC